MVVIPMSAAHPGQKFCANHGPKNINELISAMHMGGFWISNNDI